MRYIKLYAYLNNNLGDDLMVDILLTRYPNYHFIYMGKANNYQPLSSRSNFITRKKLTQKWKVADRLICALTGGKKRHFFADYLLDRMRQNAVCAVHIGGSIFIEHSAASIQAEQEREKMNGAPLFIIGANFGPYQNQEFLESFRTCFRDAADICFRDQMSFQLFSELSNVRYAPDVVFNYTGANIEKPSNEAIISVIDFRSRPTLLPYAEAYEKFICDICRSCVHRKMMPVLMSFCKNEGDEIAINRIHDALPDEIRKETAFYFYNDTYSAVKKLAEAEFVIATRFHAMILSLLFHVPFFSIAYDHKISNVLDDIHCQDYCLPAEIGTLHADEILDRIQACAPIDQIRQRAADQFMGLDQFLLQLP